MLDNSADKIKAFSKIYLSIFMTIAVLIFVAVVVGVCVLLSKFGGKSIGIEVYVTIIGSASLVLLGIMISIYITSLLIHGYGELIENTSITASRLNEIVRRSR